MRKQKHETSLGHDLVILAFIMFLSYAGWWIYDQSRIIDKERENLFNKQQEANTAWIEVAKAQERKAQLEEDAKKVEARIEAINKKLLETKESYKRIDRIQKDLDRIVGKWYYNGYVYWALGNPKSL